MQWTYLVGVLATLDVILIGLGAAFSLFSNGLLASGLAEASITVLAVVAAVVIAFSALGSRDGGTQRTPYW